MIDASEILASDKKPVNVKVMSGKNLPIVKNDGRLFPITSNVAIKRIITVANRTILAKLENIPVRAEDCVDDCFRG